MKTFISGILLVVLVLTNQIHSQNLPKPPLAPTGPVIEKYWGVEIEDTYRNLENLKDSSVQNWFKAESEYANKLLANISGRDELIEKFKRFDERKSSVVTDIKVTENDEYFYLKREADENVSKLYYRKTFNSDEELIYNPKDYKLQSGNEYVINYIQPSWNGAYVAVAITFGGSEISEMIIIDMSSKKVLPHTITHCWPSDGGGVSWLPDNKSFIYLYYPVIEPTSKMFLKNTKSVLYKIGDDPEKLNVILGAETNPELNIAQEDFPGVSLINKNDKYLIGYIGGASIYSDAYFAQVSDIASGNLTWKPLFKKELKIYKGFFEGDEFVYMTADKSPNYKIASTKVEQADFNNPKIIVNEDKDEVIDDFYITSGGIYYVKTKNGVEAKLYCYDGKTEKNIDLPKRAGRIRLSCKGIEYPEIWINTAGWTYDYQRFRYDKMNDHFIEENLVPTVSFPEFEDFVVKEVLVKSYDGEEIPLSIIHKKNIEMNGMNPTLFFGYGSYGASINPFFSSYFLTWVDEGGIFCLAHVRGGGEKGDSWHYGGFKQTKYNTWKDLIACTEYMINEGYTSNKHTVINSASAGGILIGRAMTDRPDLFAVAIPEVGVMNTLRFEETPNGPNNTKEFGTIKDSSECMALMEMDSYLKIRKGEKYPATLITCGMNDPRVIVWEPGKFAAKLQALNGSDRPIIFHVDYESGHGINDTKLKIFEQIANIFSFAFWQTGNKKYKLIIE